MRRISVFLFFLVGTVLFLGSAYLPQSAEAVYSSAERAALAELTARESKVEVVQVSDRRFGAITVKWREGIGRLVESERCNRYDNLIRREVDGDTQMFMIAKAVMIVESACDPEVIGTGGGTNYGLMQVQEVACNDVGVKGNLLDPETNIRCGVAYLKALCSRYDRCTIAEKVVAYNAGPTGADRIDDKEAFDYTRRVGYVLYHMMRSTRSSFS